MKVKIAVFSIPVTFFILSITLPNSSIADWFNGWNNTNTQNSDTGNASGSGTGSGDGSTSGRSNVSGWGTSKADVDGEADFTIKLKVKGRTNMDTKMSGDGYTDFAGNAIGDTSAVGNTAGNYMGSSSGSNKNGYSGYNSNPWNGGRYRRGYGQSQPQLPVQHVPGQQMMPLYSEQVPQIQMMPQQMIPNSYSNAYPTFGYGFRPQMRLIPPQPPQAPSYQEVVKRQEAIRKQLQDQQQERRSPQQSSTADK